MANQTPPKRLKWPFGAYQWKLLDDMIAELYRRVFSLEKVIPSTPSNISTNTTTTIIQPMESVSVDDIDGLLGEMSSFMTPRRSGGGISGLTAGRVPFAASPESLTDDADLTFATDTLTATKLVVPTSVIVGLTTNAAGQVYVGFDTDTRLFLDGAGTTAFGQTTYRKARGTQASRSDVVDQDTLGRMEFQGYSASGGTGYADGASLLAKVDGAVVSGQAVPTAFVIATNAVNATPVNRMIVASTGYVGIHVDPPQIFLHVKGTASGTLPASSGTVAVGVARFTDTSSVSTDFGASPNSPFPAWIQVHDSGNQAVNYPLALQPNGGMVGIGLLAPMASLHLPAGTAAASTAPLKFTSGTVLTSPEAGTIEYDGTDFYLTP